MAAPSISRFAHTLICAIMATTALLLATDDVRAADPPPPYPAFPVCDIDFMKSLKEKAHAETQREIEINNSIITKPDSVLALSCFDGHMAKIDSGSGIFSNKYNNGVKISTAIATTFGNSFTQFVNANFAKDLGEPVTYGNNAVGCKNIANIWKAVKCTTSKIIPFMTLEELRANQANGKDLRSGGNAFDCKASADTYETGLKASLDMAGMVKTRGAKYFDVVRPNWCATDGKEGSDPFADSKICKDSKDKELKCSDMPAIPTGMIVSYTEPLKSGNNTLPKGTFVWTFQCINPGCYFDVPANEGKIRYNAGGKPDSTLKCAAKPY